jgi:twitching motility two-component system response regulator PilG
MTTTISVGIMGFSVPEQTRLKQIFALSQTHQRFYKLTDLAEIEPVEVLIVKPANASVLKQQQAYLAKHQGHPIKVVTTPVENAPAILEQSPYQIKSVLVPSRVFAVLDAIKIIAKTEFLHVLVVDDSAMMQKTIHLELEKASMPLAVDFAESGEVALEKVQRLKYDFIFLDVMMPGIDGFETCTRIRQLEGMSKTPIIMLTSKTSALDEVKGLMAGCTTYLTKPFAHDEFQTILERIMYWVKEFNNEK